MDKNTNLLLVNNSTYVHTSVSINVNKVTSVTNGYSKRLN